MSDTKHEFASALGGFFGLRQPTAMQVAKVQTVDTGDLTADVEDSSGLVLYNVRLRPSIDGSDEGVLLVPAVGSYVIIGQVGDGEWAILNSSSVTEISLTIGGADLTVTQTGFSFQKGTTRLELDNTGVLIEKAGQSLKTVLDLIVDQIKLITVTCAAPGAPSTPPINIAAFNAIKTQIGQLLK
jgi:hypothetical protein